MENIIPVFMTITQNPTGQSPHMGNRSTIPSDIKTTFSSLEEGVVHQHSARHRACSVL